MINLNYNTYLLGDSRAHSIKDKLEFIGIHNFSKPSDSFHDILNKIRYLTKKTNLNQIILDVGEHQLSDYRVRTNNNDLSNLLTIDRTMPLTKKIKIYYGIIANKKMQTLSRKFLKNKLKIFGEVDHQPNPWFELAPEVRVEKAKKRLEYQFKKTKIEKIT